MEKGNSLGTSDPEEDAQEETDTGKIRKAQGRFQTSIS